MDLPLGGTDPRTARGASAARWASLALLGAGAILRLVQYFGRASYWLDELPLARMIERFSTVRLLTQPLRFQQAAPPGFLAIEKLMQKMFGTGESSLRFLPVAASIATLVLVHRILRRIPVSDWSVAGGCALVAFSPGLIFHGVELHPYSTDVACAAGLALLAVKDLPRHRPSVALLAAAAAAPWFSSQSVFVVSAIALVFVGDAATRRFRGSGRALGFAVVALTSAAAATLVSRALITPRTLSYFREFWGLGFAPPVFRVALFGEWLGGAIRGFWTMFLEFPAPRVGLALLLAGILSRSRNPGVLAVLLLPAAAALAAASFQLYPFQDRAVAFLAPAAIVLSASSLDLLGFFAGRVREVARAGGFALLAALALIGLARHHPFSERQATRELLKRLARLRQPGDSIFVESGARQAFAFYGPPAGLTLDGVTLGPCRGPGPRAFAESLAPLAGRRRVWIFEADLLPSNRADKFFDAYLPGRGRRLFAMAGEPRHANTRVLLVDLSGKPRSNWPFDQPAESHPRRRPSCVGGPRVPDPEFVP
ncbi:MAG: glycosyltransferase family 39 protein [Thermoanaerobaculia bacterium]